MSRKLMQNKRAESAPAFRLTSGRGLAQAITTILVLGAPAAIAMPESAKLPPKLKEAQQPVPLSVDFPAATAATMRENGAVFSIEPEISEEEIAKLSKPVEAFDDVPETAALTVGEGGRWSAVEDWPVLAVHAALMPNGKVLAWDATPDDFDTDPHTVGTSSTRVTFWDPITNTHQSVNSTTQYDLFCAGSAHLPDGSLLFSGGDSGRGGGNGPDSGSSSFNPFNMSWTREDDLATRRWYSSMATMPSGEMITWGGSYLAANSPMGEVFGLDGQWRSLSARPSYGVSGDYQWLQAAPNGQIAHLGPSNNISFINSEADSVDGVKARDSIFRGYGSFAVYTNGKALVTGGGASVTSSVVVDLNNLGVQSTGPMNIGRRQHNLTVLADGSVLATGGNNTGSGLVDMNGAVYDAESWDPATGQWTTLSRMATNRQYHSVALLLADGRVLSAGGGYCGTCKAVGYLEQNAEVFSPPYLFNANGSAATRPVIQQAPTALGYGLPFQMTVAAAQVSKLHLIKLGSTTHSANQDQRLVPLSYQASGSGTVTLSVEGPDNRNLAPPGHYMLIAVNNAGVPSVSKIVKVGDVETNFASNGTATQSTTYSVASAARAIDGDSNGVYNGGSVTHTSTESQPWWQVDLGSVRAIENVQLFNRTDCCSSRLNNVYVFVSENPITGSTVASAQAQSGVTTVRYPGTVGARANLSVDGVGRYVRVQLGGTGILSLAEVKVLGSAPSNLALGSNATQSSNYQSVSTASRAVDGDTMGNHGQAPIAITRSQANAWWQTDLGATARIGEIAIHGRQDCCSERLSNFYVFTSEQPISGSLASLLANSAVESTYHAGSFNGVKRFQMDSNARYVRVQLSGSNYLELTEVEVFAKLGEQTDTGGGDSRELVSGRAVGGNAALGGWTYYTIDATAAHSLLQVDLTGLQADVDVYVRAGQRPSGHVDEGGAYDCGSTLGGSSSERCVLANTGNTQWHIGVYGYNASVYTLKATLTTGGGNSGSTLELGKSVSDGVERGDWKHYEVSVPANITELQFDLSDMTADGDLYVRKGQRTSGSQGAGGQYDCGSTAGGSTSERCVVYNSGVNTYHVSVHGYNGTSFKLAAVGHQVTSNDAVSLSSGVSKSGSVEHQKWKYFRIDSGADVSRLSVQLDGLNNDADLYVRAGSLPSGDPSSGANSDCISLLGSNSDESCEMANTGATSWYIGVYGYQASNFRLTATLSNQTTRSLSKRMTFEKGVDAKAAMQESADGAVSGGGGAGVALPLIALLAMRGRRRKQR